MDGRRFAIELRKANTIKSQVPDLQRDVTKDLQAVSGQTPARALLA
jgi:hypothetical protein